VSTRLAIVAEPAAAGLAGLDGSFDWGEATTAGPGTPPPEADLVVALGVAEAGAREPDLRWLGTAPPPAAAASARVVAPSGDGLWSRAPWPVRDEVFELSEPDPGGGILVIGGDAGLLDKLAGRGIRHRDAPELTPGDLAGAGVVAFPPRSEGERADAVPAAAFAVLAARRFLIAPRAGVTFGLLPGVDHLAAGTEDEVVQYADALQTFPEAFGLQAALGRVAAERQRASTVYGRVAAELEAERAAA